MALSTAHVTNPELEAFIITTSFKGVFYVELDVAAQGDALYDPKLIKDAKNVRMAVGFGTDFGFMELAFTGPTAQSRISYPADFDVIHSITSICRVTEQARKAWVEWHDGQ